MLCSKVCINVISSVSTTLYEDIASVRQTDTYTWSEAVVVGVYFPLLYCTTTEPTALLMKGKTMKGYMGYPIIKEKQLNVDSNAWVKSDVVSLFHLQYYPSTTKAYSLFIDGELPTTDCEGTDCCMVGNTLWYGLHKIREGLI